MFFDPWFWMEVFSRIWFIAPCEIPLYLLEKLPFLILLPVLFAFLCYRGAKCFLKHRKDGEVTDAD